MNVLRRLLWSFLVVALAAGLRPAAGQDDDPNAWPRTFETDGYKFTLYQPQIEKWDGTRLLTRAAVAVETASSPIATYGVVWVVARTEVDKEERLVTLDRFAIPRVSFPSAPDRANVWLDLLRKHAPFHVRTIDLARLETGLTVMATSAAATASPEVKNDPPRIIFTTRPSILVLTDGKPALRKVPGSPLLRVVNTRALLIQDPATSGWYLAAGDRWLQASSLEGPWTLATALPEGADAAKAAAVASKQVDLYESNPELKKVFDAGEAPTVFTSDSPAELIETQGEPNFVPVAGTSLIYAQNTDADIFVNAATGDMYVLVSGRWFKAPSRRGPWTFVAPNELPADFAKIPETHPAGEVLSSVAGTPQAQEALIANQIPQTATVSRSQAQLDVTYDGAPQMATIDGTSMQYAINSATPVIQVGGFFYACENGVWFVSSSPTGPWAVADTVPPEIYSIPASSPVHYVTYVRVYDSSPDWVSYGYTPGYLGTCVYGGCVCWGTGWWWNPWIGGVWIGRPWTYGFGCGIRWNVGFGWSFGFGFGAWPCRPWWGPFAHPHPAFWPGYGYGYHLNVNNANIYGAWHGAVRVSAAARSRTPVVPGPGQRPLRAATAPRGPNNIYSTHEGNVYRNSGGSWERQQGGNWRSAGPATRELEAERGAREAGQTRAQNFRQSAPAPVPHTTIGPGLRGSSHVHRGR
jgi:hypothetical protein